MLVNYGFGELPASARVTPAKVSKKKKESSEVVSCRNKLYSAGPADDFQRTSPAARGSGRVLPGSYSGLC